MHINRQDQLYKQTTCNNTGIRANSSTTPQTNINFKNSLVQNDGVPVSERGVPDDIQAPDSQKAESPANQSQTVSEGGPDNTALSKPSASNHIYQERGWELENLEDGGYKLINPDGEDYIVYDSNGIEQNGMIYGNSFVTKTNSDGTYTRTFDNESVLNYNNSGQETGGMDENGDVFASVEQGDFCTRICTDGKIMEIKHNKLISEYERDNHSNFIQTQYEYDESGRVSKEQIYINNHLSEISDYEYLPNGNEIKTTQKGNSTIRSEYEYDASGYQTKLTISADGKTPRIAEYERDSEHRVVKKTTTWGNTPPEVIEYQYLQNGNKIQTVKSGDTTIRNVYDSSNNIIEQTIKRVDNPPVKTSYKYDNFGNIISETTCEANKTTQVKKYKYDEMGRCTSAVTIKGGEKIMSEEREYNNHGISRKTVKTENGTEIYEYNINQTLRSCTTISNGKTTKVDYKYEYDEDGNLLRSTNSAGGMSFEQHIEANGMFDEPISQNGTGDCWLLSGLESIMMRPEGREYLESLVRFDEISGDAEVTLPGVGKIYTVTYAEMERANFLANGDGDIRVFELAMHKLMEKNPEFKERLHEDTGMAIEGGWSQYVFDAVMPKPNSTMFECEVSYFNMNNFGNNDYATTASIWNTSEEGRAIGPDGKEVNLPNGHEYSVYNKDDKYVYIQNPWDDFYPDEPEKNLLKMPIADFNKYFDAVSTRPLNFPKYITNSQEITEGPIRMLAGSYDFGGRLAVVPEFDPMSIKFEPQ